MTHKENTHFSENRNAKNTRKILATDFKMV